MSNSNTGTGIGFSSLLTLLFIGLKLGKVIDWSWWWVISPVLIDFGLIILVLLILLLIKASK
jgi:hypothetical protein